MTTPGSNGPDQQPGGGAPGWGQPPAGPPGGYSPPPPPPPGGSTPPPPPPPGGFPQGQYPPQQGASAYPPQGGAPYPPQGGAPYQPQAGGFGAPQRSGPPKWLIPVIAGVVLVAGALALFAFFGGTQAEVDDCVSANAAGEVEVVDCDDDSAVARVVGFDDDDITYDDYLSSDADFCGDVQGAVTHFWEGQEDEEGRVVCVGEI